MDEPKSKKLSKAPSTKEISFSVEDKRNLAISPPKKEKLTKKNRAKSVTNLKEHFRSRSLIDSSRNILSKSPSTTPSAEESGDTAFVETTPTKPRSFKIRSDESSTSSGLSPSEQTPPSSDKKKARRATSSRKVKVKTPRKTTITEDVLTSISYNPKLYWAEGFTESPPQENADDLFLVDDQESAELFPIQEFNIHNVYEKIFMNVQHANFMGIDEVMGPILIAITRDPVDDEGQVLQTSKMGKKQLSERNLLKSNPPNSSVRFEDSEKPTLPVSPRTDGIRRTFTGIFGRGNNQDQECIGYHHVLIRFKLGDKLVKMPSLKSKSVKNSKALLNALISLSPPVPFNWEDIDFKETNIPYACIKEMEEKLSTDKYKFGVIFAKEGQTNDDQMLSNTEGSNDFERFMRLIARKVELKGWHHYNGGLDVSQNESTGNHSYYTKFRGFEIMFHVSTLLPHLEGDEQHVEKKRHIGNDVVVIVFQDGNTPFDPESIKSVFNHVFIVIRKDNSSIESNDDEKSLSTYDLNIKEESDLEESKSSKSNEVQLTIETENNHFNLDSSSDERNTSKDSGDTEHLNDEDDRSFLHVRQDSNEDSSTNSTEDHPDRSIKRRMSQRGAKIQLKKGKPQRFSKSMTELQKARLSVNAKWRAQNPPPKYRIEIVSKSGVVESIPKLPDPPIFSSGPYLKEFLLTKLINCERASYFSPHFAKPMERTKEVLLQDLYNQSFKS